MNESMLLSSPSCTAFVGTRRLASGPLQEVAQAVKRAQEGGEQGTILLFDDETSRMVELDARGELLGVQTSATMEETQAKRGPGRPKLGVVAREVTLLPRHWEWLNEQPGGASVALRKLVEEARRSGKDRLRQAQEAVHRFMYAMAGDFSGFEEAYRAFYAGDWDRMDGFTASWPEDVRSHLGSLVAKVREAGPA